MTPKDFPYDEWGWFSHEDTTCYVLCKCGEDLPDIVSNYKIIRCPKCGRGYKTEFKVWLYEKNENKNE